MKVLIANWKMAPQTSKQALALASATAAIGKKYKKSIQLIACVPYLYLQTLIQKNKTLCFGAQNVSSHTAIASTGEVGASLLKGVGTTYCIVGHSEVRSQGDTNELIREKINILLSNSISPIICIGERERDERGWYLSTIKDQVESAFAGISKQLLKKSIIAYEPVWAIGSEALREATPAECREMVLFIRKLLTDMYDEKIAHSVTILYGGSVTEQNAALFVTEGAADGLLVGRMSLEPKRFITIAGRIAS